MSKNKAYETLVTVAADTVEVLRRCDVYRLIETSENVQGVDTTAFAKWLVGRRPDLADEVRECLLEIGK